MSSPEQQTFNVILTMAEPWHPDPQTESGWISADWLVTVGTVLEEGTFRGVDGHIITYKAPVIEKIIKTALNADINVFHPNRPEERIEKAGRVYGVFSENGKGKVKYVTWDDIANEGIKNKRFNLSMEASVLTIKTGDNTYDAVGGRIPTVALVENQAVPGAINEQVSAVALEKAKLDALQSANAEPGIKFPASAQLSEKDLSPCIALLEKNGLTVSKGETNVSNEGNEGNPPEGGKGDPGTTTQPVIQEKPPVEPTTGAVVEPVEPEVSKEEFQAMQAKLEVMSAAMETSAVKIAKLEGTDLETIKSKITKVAPKTDFKILLLGAESPKEQKLVLNAHLAGLASRDSPDVNLEGVDEENQAEKPDAKEMETHYMKQLGFSEAQIKEMVPPEEEGAEK